MTMNCSEFEFRVGTATYESIVALLLGYSDSFRPPLYTYVNMEEYARKILDNAVTFEAWGGSELVGFIVAYFNDNETKNGFVTNVSVLEEYQDCGIAYELMRQAIEFGKNHAFVRLDLEAGTDSTRAQRSYKRNGFVVVEQRRDKFVMSRMITTEAPNE